MPKLLKNFLMSLSVLVVLIVGSLLSIILDIIGWIFAVGFLLLAWVVYGADTLNQLRKRRGKR